MAVDPFSFPDLKNDAVHFELHCCQGGERRRRKKKTKTAFLEVKQYQDNQTLSS